MPVAFTPIEAVIVKAINQDEFKDFSYQNPDWRCLERGEVPKDDANDGRRALRDDLPVNMKQPLPMTPILSHPSAGNETVSSAITVVKTDHTPIPHLETKRNSTASSTLLNSMPSSASASLPSNSSAAASSQAKSIAQMKSSSMNRSTTDQTDM